MLWVSFYPTLDWHDKIITFLRFFLVFVKKSTCRQQENLPIARLYNYPFSLCAACTLTTVVQQCNCSSAQEGNNSTSCGQVVGTHTTLRQQTNLQQLYKRTSRVSYVRTIRFDLSCTSTAVYTFTTFIRQKGDCILLEIRNLLVKPVSDKGRALSHA